MKVFEYMFYPIAGLIFTFMLFCNGELGYALITGIVTVVITLLSVGRYFKEIQPSNSKFKKWLKGKK